MRKLRENEKNVNYLTKLTLRYKAKTIYKYAYLLDMKIFNLFKYIFHNLHCNELESNSSTMALIVKHVTCVVYIY